MGLLGDLKGPVLGFALSALAFLAVALYGLYDLLTTLPEARSVAGLLGTVVFWLLVLLVVLAFAIGFLAWGLYRAAKSVDTDSRLFQNRYVRELGSLVGIDDGRSANRVGEAPGRTGGQSPGQRGGQTGGRPDEQRGGQRTGSGGQRGGRSPGQDPGQNPGQRSEPPEHNRVSGGDDEPRGSGGQSGQSGQR